MRGPRVRNEAQASSASNFGVLMKQLMHGSNSFTKDRDNKGVVYTVDVAGFVCEMVSK